MLIKSIIGNFRLQTENLSLGDIKRRWFRIDEKLPPDAKKGFFALLTTTINLKTSNNEN